MHIYPLDTILVVKNKNKHATEAFIHHQENAHCAKFQLSVLRLSFFSYRNFLLDIYALRLVKKIGCCDYFMQGGH